MEKAWNKKIIRLFFHDRWEKFFPFFSIIDNLIKNFIAFLQDSSEGFSFLQLFEKFSRVKTSMVSFSKNKKLRLFSFDWEIKTTSLVKIKEKSKIYPRVQTIWQKFKIHPLWRSVRKFSPTPAKKEQITVTYFAPLHLIFLGKKIHPRLINHRTFAQFPFINIIIFYFYFSLASYIFSSHAISFRLSVFCWGLCVLLFNFFF